MRDDGAISFLIGLGLGLAMGVFATLATVNDIWSMHLVNQGVAHYEVDAKTGKTKFVIDKKEQ